MPRSRDWRERKFGKRPADLISRDELLHYVDIMLDCVDEVGPPELFNVCMLVASHLIETELAHWGDK